MEPECSEVINGPNLGGFLGLAPDLRRLGRQGLAWLSGTQGLLLDQAFWHFPKSGLFWHHASSIQLKPALTG